MVQSETIQTEAAHATVTHPHTEVVIETERRIGAWEPIQHSFNHLPIHMALLRTGKVLAFGGSGNDEHSLKKPHPAEIWDPKAGNLKAVPQELAGDLFCVGQAFLPDGRLLVAGGTHKYNEDLFGLPISPFRGLNHSYTFDPVTETWTRLGDLSTGRWYPTLVSLGDGHVVAMAGLTESFPWAFLRRVEIFDPGAGWTTLRGAGRWLPLYPRLHLLPSGEIFYSGSYNTHYGFPFTRWVFPTKILNTVSRKWRPVGRLNESQREEGTSVLLPLIPPDYRARILLIGGGKPGGTHATSEVEIIDFSKDQPKWETVDSMHHARYWAYSTILPDGRVLVLGGRSGHTGHGKDHETEHRTVSDGIPQDPRAVHIPEIFDPADGKWTEMATMQLDRLYHSNSILLPDGRVMVAGSNPDRRVNELRIEIYHPPYLFKGPRPIIQECPEAIRHGSTFELTAAGIDEEGTIALIRPSATTHCLDADQRYLGLTSNGLSGGSFAVTVPGNPNLAPPGYYMLFAVTGDGVPSEAKFVQLH